MDTALSIPSDVAACDSAQMLPAQRLEAAHVAMRFRRWDEAASLLEALASDDAAIGLKLRFSRNLGSLQKHRPLVYETIISLPSDARYGVGPASQGRPTVVVVREDGTRIGLSPNHDPITSAQNALKSLAPALESGNGFAFCGTGDGYLLKLLALQPSRLFMDMQQPIFFIENDPQVLLQCLMIHDYSGPSGPIEQKRFFWFVGAHWEANLFQTCLSDVYLPCPAHTACQGLNSTPMAQGCERLVAAVLDRDRETRRRVEGWYSGLTANTLAELLGPKPPRKPRVLIMTTRFSTVLQYSSNDIAAAFQQLGWEAQLLIEPSPIHRLLNVATRTVLDEFKPDLLFQIDHLRYEHGEVFPANLPFICWIQDHLSNLRTEQAAASIGPRDFVLTDAPAMYAGTFGYPARQCLALTKLTSEPAPVAPVSGVTAPVEDLVFVSNASFVPDTIIRQRLGTYDGSSQGKMLLEACANRLLGIYASGGTVGTYYEILQLMREVRGELQSILAVDELDGIAAWLAHPLNDALYRQQTLSWASNIAGEMGLTLGLYGKGWENHPTLKRHARGPVAYGPALERLTRGARFNLQIVPYLCLHQRLLDGLSAGGFFLIRSHTSEIDTQHLLDFIHLNCPAAMTTAAARAVLPPSLHEQLAGLCSLARPAIATSDRDDPVEAVQQWAEMGLLIPRGQVLPRFDLNSFSDAASLQAAITRFTASPALQDELQQAQRDRVMSRFTYVAGMKQVIRGIYDRFTDKELTRSWADRRAV